MNILSRMFKKDKKEKNLTLQEKWELDLKASQDPNYKVKTGEIQCYKCLNRIKTNTLKCSKYDIIPKEIIQDKIECKYRFVEKEV